MLEQKGQKTVTLIEMKKTTDRIQIDRENQKFNFRHKKLKNPERYPSEDVKETVGYMIQNTEEIFKREI